MANFKELIGRKTTFCVKGEPSRLYGEIQGIDKENRTITFYRVTLQEPGKESRILNGLQTYTFDEINDVSVTDHVNQALRCASLRKSYKRNPYPEKKRNIRYIQKIPRHLQNLEYDTTTLYMMNIVENEIENSRDASGQYGSELPHDCTLLCDHESKLFKKAIGYLKEQALVGVAFEGVGLGRSGQLSWVSVSTRDHTMFFDIKTMGKAGFDAGLRDLLQYPKTTKVIHDCRRPSDFLYHQYETKLINVFDTQVGAVLGFKALNNNIFPRYVTCLAECLRNDLRLDEEEIHVPYLREYNRQDDEEVWNLRPAPSIVYTWMLKHCCHLLALRDRQMELLMMEFTLGVDLYLKSLRDLHKGECEARMTMQHLLPTEYMSLPMMVKARWKKEQPRRNLSRQQGSMEKDEHGMIENWTGFPHPAIVSNRDSISHLRQLKTKKKSGRRGGPMGHSSRETPPSLPLRCGSQQARNEDPDKSSKAKDGEEERKTEVSHPNSMSDKQEAPVNGPSEQHSCTRCNPKRDTSEPSPEKWQMAWNCVSDRQQIARNSGKEPSSDRQQMLRNDLKHSLSDKQQVVKNDPDEQRVTSPGEQVLRNGPSELRSSLTSQLSERPTNGLPSPSECDSAAEGSTGSESKPTGLVAAKLSQAVEAHQEKEQNVKDIHNMAYYFRPSGELVAFRRKQKKTELSKAVGDQVNRSMTNSPVLDPKLENEFDCIPSQSELMEINRTSQIAFGNSFVVTPEQEPLRYDGGFNITTFKEAISPPPCTVTPHIRKDDAQEALAAIFPRVSNQAVLLEGSRTSMCFLQHRRKRSSGNENNSSDTEIVTYDIRSKESPSGGLLKRKHYLRSANSSSDLDTQTNSVGIHSCIPVMSPLRVQKTSDVECHTPTTTQFSDTKSHMSTAEKGADDKTASVSILSQKLSFEELQDKGAVSSRSSLSAASPSAVSSFAAQADRGSTSGQAVCSSMLPVQNGAMVSMQSADNAGMSIPFSDGAVVAGHSSNSSLVSSQPSDTSSPVTVSSSDSSPQTSSVSQWQSEIRKAIAKGESLMSILGFKMSPQEMMASKFRATQDQKQNMGALEQGRGRGMGRGLSKRE